MNNQKNDLLDLATTVQFEEKELLANFQVEELEKRYEMAWVDSVTATVVTPYGNIGVRIPIGQ